MRTNSTRFCIFRQCLPIWRIHTYEIEVKLEKLISNSTDDIHVRVEESNFDSDIRHFDEIERTYNIIHLMFVFWIPTFIVVGSYCFIIVILNSFSNNETDGDSEIKISRPERVSFSPILIHAHHYLLSYKQYFLLLLSQY